VETQKKYDLTGVNGAAVYRDLPEGLKLRMVTGEIVQILANAHDGAILIVKTIENEKNPSSVGDEQAIFYADVKEVVYD